jgi:hypothetical protein
MTSCEYFEAKLLHDAYGLLDTAEARALQEHLSGCLACQAARERAQVQQRLLAAAAKEQFADVHFTPLPEEPAAPRSPRILSRPWLRWAVPAAAVIVVGFSAVAGLKWWGCYQDVEQAQKAHDQALDEKKQYAQRQSEEEVRSARELEEHQKESRNLQTRWSAEAREVERAQKSRELQVIISGPRTLEAGAPNRYQIQTRDRNNVPRGGKIRVGVVDAKSKQECFQTDLLNESGNAVLDLPSNLPLTPGAQLTLLVTAETKDGGQARVSEKLPLVAPVYLTHLTTDRPLYRPGEVVRFRSLTLERFSLKPAQENLQLHYRITNPLGAEVFNLQGSALLVRDGKTVPGPDGKPLRGIGAGEFPIPFGSPGGEYTLSVSETQNRFAVETRKFLVNQYQAPRLNKELEYSRKSYGPGEEVEALCKVARVEGGTPLVNQPVTPTVQVDGRPCPLVGGVLRTDSQGKVPPIRFKLPDRIDRGAGTLSVQFTDGANLETLVRPIPIVLRKLHVEFFPEGGDLVAGVSNRVYFQVRTTLNKLAELAGRLVDGQGNTVALVQTLSDSSQPGINQGMGAFEFTPATGQAYELKIEVPIGIEGRYPLPAARPQGVVLSIAQGVVTDKIDAVLHSVGGDRPLLVGAYCRGRLLDHARVLAKAGEATRVTLKPAAEAGGVYRVTVFEETARGTLKPLAERLIYRRTAEQLHVTITADKDSYSPGERVNLWVNAQNEKKQKTPAVLLVKVVDQSILKLADEKTARTMPTQFYLGSEVRKAEDLEYADFLLSAHPQAAAALDLLLGTQGWRRFAEQDPVKFRQQQRQDADRLLLASGQSAPQVANLTQLKMKEVDDKFAPQVANLQTALAEKQTAQVERRQKVQTERTRLENQLRLAQADQHTAQARLDEFSRSMIRIGIGMGILGALLAAGASLAVGLVRQGSQEHRAWPWFVTAGSALVFVVSAGAIFFVKDNPDERTLAAANLKQVGTGFHKVPNQREARRAVLAEAAPAAPVATEDKKANLEAGQPAKQAPGVDPTAKELADDKLHLNWNMPADMFVGNAAQLDKLAEGKPMVGGGPGRGVGGGGLGGPAGIGGFGGIQGGFQGGLGGQDINGDFEQGRHLMALAQARGGRNVKRLPAAQPLVVREYAHQHQTSPDHTRRDFAETVYWHPMLVLTSGNGAASFDLPDSTTTFEIQAWGHTLDGRLGAATGEVVSRLPFSLEPKLPIEVTSSDKVIIPVSVASSAAGQKKVDVHAEATGLKVLGNADRQVTVAADRPVRELFAFQPTLVDGPVSVRFRGTCEPLGADRIERTFKVVPEGFPIVGAHSDLLEGTAQTTITLPETWIKGTLQCQAEVFPSTLAALQKGLESLLREPGGCFEQTSSSNYPNVLILNYLKESSQTRPEIEQRARGLLASGYRQLVQFECLSRDNDVPRKGYEWFGGAAPAHEALTAYGLLEFRDMAKVHSVDAAMVERTRRYLLARRDGKGGFLRNPQALDSFGRAPEHITNAYIVWALTESGTEDKLDTELNALAEQAKTSKDPYFLALVGNSLLNRGKTDEGIAILKTLVAAQKDDGHLQALETSITGSGGRDLEIETTALATLAWLKANRPGQFHPAIEKAVRWIGQQRGGYGGFGSTQSTILALKALIGYTRENRKTAEAGDLKLFLNDATESVGVKHFTAGTLDPVVVSLPREDLLKPGQNKLRVQMTGKNAFPYTLTWSYRTLKPANADNCPVHLTTKLDHTQAKEGDTVRLTTVVQNKTGKGQGMAVAVVGLPGGLALPEDLRQLKDLALLRDNDTKPGTISAFEIRGRELVLYWRDLAPDQQIEVNLDLICRIPGEYRGPASRAYLYYNADHKYWVEPLAVSIGQK